MSNTSEQLVYSNKIRELCLRYYMPAKTLKDGTHNKEYTVLSQDALFASEAMVSIACVFKSLETYNPSYILPVIVALSFGLAENQFWKRFNPVLVPVFKSALHAAISAKMLDLDADKSDTKAVIKQRQAKQWHSIFIVVYDCMYGTARAQDIGVAMLQELEIIA